MVAQNKKEQKKALILSCAEELFARHSFHQVLMDDVARLAGIGKGTLYNYFRTKEELYSQIISNKLEKLLRDLTERIQTHDEPLLNLRRLVIHTYSFMVKYADFFRIWNREKTKISSNQTSLSGACIQNIQNLTLNVLQQGQSDGVFIPDFSADFQVDLIFGMIEAAVSRACRFSIEQQRKDRNMLFLFIVQSIASDYGKQIVSKSPELNGKLSYAHSS